MRCAACLVLLLPLARGLAGEAPALAAWREGQKALMAERFDQAVEHFRASLRADPDLPQAHLGMATAQLARGEDADAVPHLLRYVALKPEHLVIRLHLGELLLRLDRRELGRVHLERFVAEAPDQPALAEEHLVRCHSRLMDLAREAGDEYRERLHRGAGLYYLAERGGPGLDGVVAGTTVEALLIKAAGELTLARLERPDTARPCWYLHLVWMRLGQRQPALRWLRAAEARANVGEMTSAERRHLQEALARVQNEGR